MRIGTIWPFRHFGLKVLSVVLAVLLWLMVSGEETVERGLRIPLELQQFPSALELRSEPPSNIDVRVRGGSGVLSRLSPVDVVAVLDLHTAQAGQRLFPLTPDQIRAPFGVEVVQITPATVALVFEKAAVKQVPVVIPGVEGKPAAGFVVGRWTVDPPTVEIIGPESAVKRATTALTEPISVAGARDHVKATVTVGMLDSSLRLKTSRSAVVDVQISPAPFERVVRDAPVRLLNLASNLAAQSNPSAVALTVSGTRDGVNRAGVDGVSASVDLLGLGVGQYTLAVHADAAGDAGVTRVEPSVVRVRVSSVKN
jgi:YbbR domain-containing protein